MLVKNKSNVSSAAGVYNIPREGCQLFYDGETARGLHARLKEHKYALGTGYDDNALFNNMGNTNHRISWEKHSNLVYNCNDFKQCQVIEAMCTRKQSNFDFCDGNSSSIWERGHWFRSLFQPP